MQTSFIQSTLCDAKDIPDDFSSFVSDIGLSEPGCQKFRQLIYNYYAQHKREFAWRNCDNPYFVVVSEIMLQQTQTDRVRHKFQEFITAFPTLTCLAQASVRDVIAYWQGLGYNRRALAMHTFAQRVLTEYKGIIPNDPEILQQFKGIGPATAASICAFAYNKPTVFIETNIRAVFIHCFFKDQIAIHDKIILPLIGQTLDRQNPREWYYALMDYGVMLKKQYKNPSRKSAHYTVQSKFEGSDRQIRGAILKALITHNSLTEHELAHIIQKDPKRVSKHVRELVQEKFVTCTDSFYSLAT